MESRGAGTPLIVGHGLSGNRGVVLEQFAHLTGAYQIIAFDQRGHGESTPLTELSAYDPKAMADDIKAVLDDLGIPKAVVAGESMGAASALLFALEHPERVEKLLLTGPAFGDEPSSQRARLRKVGEDLLALGVDAFLVGYQRRLRDDLGMAESAVASQVRVFTSHEPASLAAAFKAVAEWVPLPDLSALERLRIPSHVVAWRGDDLHPWWLAQAMVRRLPDAELDELPSVVAVLSDPPIVGRAHGRFLMAR